MKKMIKMILFVAALSTSYSALSNSVQIFEQPKAKAKLVGSITGGTQIIPVYYPNGGDWLKVANPKNGQVGWVKLSDLKGQSTLPGLQEVRFNQRFEKTQTTDGKPEVVRIIEYKGPNQLSSQEIKTLVREMQTRQSQIDGTMQLMMRAMMQDLNHFARRDVLSFEDDFFTFPFIQPMLIVPQQGDADKVVVKEPPVKTGWWQTVKSKLFS